MAFYEGETLKKKLVQGPLMIEDAIDIAVQVAQGLAKAHERGIVHRDLKPANIVVIPDGGAKIVDFGLAKLIGQTRITRQDSAAGTAVYMSPEQALGKEVDNRTDIWALGAVLNEMLTGAPPFDSDYESAVIYRILNEEPKPLRLLRIEIPPQVEAAVLKALRKDPEQRFQNAQEFARELGRLGERPVRQSPPPRRKLLFGGLAAALMLLGAAGIYFFEPRGQAFTSVAVLPFANPGSNPELNYLCDGLSESLINSLSQLPNLRAFGTDDLSPVRAST